MKKQKTNIFQDGIYSKPHNRNYETKKTISESTVNTWSID